jgi:hypothetical protein
MQGVRIGNRMESIAAMPQEAAMRSGPLMRDLLRALPDIGAYRLTFLAQEALELPDYPGSAWRGVLGRGLRRAVCVTRAPRCPGCLLAGTCVYATLFEAPPGHGRRAHR